MSLGPGIPMMVRAANTARPFSSVVADSPVRLVFGVVSDAVTTVPACRIGLPLASWT
jgi:hypothetical protein